MWGLCCGVCVTSVWVVVRRRAAAGGALAESRQDGGDEAEEGDDRLGERPEGALVWRGKRVRESSGVCAGAVSHPGCAGSHGEQKRG